MARSTCRNLSRASGKGAIQTSPTAARFQYRLQPTAQLQTVNTTLILAALEKVPQLKFKPSLPFLLVSVLAISAYGQSPTNSPIAQQRVGAPARDWSKA